MDQQGDHSKIAPGASQSRALADVDVDESSQSADDFLASAEHPTYQRPYTELSFVALRISWWGDVVEEGPVGLAGVEQ
jgi:hypothetical protein